MSETAHRLCEVTALRPGAMRSFPVGERQILVCHTSEGLFALDNLCSHGSAELAQGRLRGHTVHCPMHGGAFDCRSGFALHSPARLPQATYALRIIDGWLEVLLPG